MEIFNPEAPFPVSLTLQRAVNLDPELGGDEVDAVMNLTLAEARGVAHALLTAADQMDGGAL